MRLNVNIIVILVSIIFQPIYGQKLYTKKVFHLPEEPAKIKSVYFDSAENYRIECEKDGLTYFYTRDKIINHLKYITGGTNGTQYKSGKDIYWTIEHCANVFGPFGNIYEPFKFPQSENQKYIALISLSGDTAKILFNGKAIANYISPKRNKVGLMSILEKSFHNEKWMAISSNGNYLYCLPGDKTDNLFLNQKKIDSFHKSIFSLLVNNKGDYMYAEFRNDHNWERQYLHYNNKVFGPERTSWDCDLKENGGYYYSGDNNGPYYILINNHLYDSIVNIGHITIVDEKDFMFTFNIYKDSLKRNYLNVNGKITPLNYEEVFDLTLDKNGGFAFFGIRNYYLYPVINGRELAPLSMYGVRAKPMYINASGKMLYYYQTDDSTYIFTDKASIFKPFSTKTEIYINDEHLFGEYKQKKANTSNSLFSILVGDSEYLVYNGVLSKPMFVDKSGHGYSKISVGNNFGKSFENGFYAIQCIGEHAFSINISNKDYYKLDDIDEFYENTIDQNAKGLIVYVRKGMDIYKISTYEN